MDANRFKLMLNNTQLQKDNPPLYQIINELITAAGAPKLAQVNQVTTIEVDTSVGPVNITLKNQVKGLTLIRDKTGNANVNNITLIGTVDGVVNPVINTSYGIERVHPSGISFGSW